MRRLLQKIFSKTVIRLANKYSSRPDKERVHTALTELYQSLNTNPGRKGITIPFDAGKEKFIILSDQHKGARNASDDFMLSEKNYLAALAYYNQQQYHYINLGDSEDLWENFMPAIKKHNKATFEQEKLFLQRGAFTKIFGNHDLYWDNDPLAAINLLDIYGEKLKVYEGMILQTSVNGQALNIYLTHGHQGDLQSDGNWFSKWFVSTIWGPIQAYLHVNPNQPSTNDTLKTLHNQLMYEWSSRQNNLLLITGHTHQPVFRSLTHLESLYVSLNKAEKEDNKAAAEKYRQQIKLLKLKGEDKFNFPGYRPTYFNSGCCCFDDGDITGIEIADNCMRLVKWKYGAQKDAERIVLDECSMVEIMQGLSTKP